VKTARAIAAGLLLLINAQCSVGAQGLGEQAVSTNPPSTATAAGETPEATLTPPPTVHLTPTPEPVDLSIRCPTPQHGLPADDALGVAILMSNGLDGTSSVYAMDLDSGILTLLAGGQNVSVYSAAVSPDRQWLAYETLHHAGISREFVLSSADGRTEVLLPWDETWLWISGSQWLNDEQVLLRQRTDQRDSLVALNPFTGNVQSLPDDFPGIYPFLHEVWWKTVFQPMLGLVLYQGYQGDQARLTLWDIGRRHEVRFIPREISPWSRPVWSPDGLRFAFSNVVAHDPATPSLPVEELFVGTADGRISQITNMSAHFTLATLGELSWSPDGRTVAFWLRASPIDVSVQYPLSPVDDVDRPSRLGMVDVEAGAVTLLCVPEGADGAAPAWSPTGRYILADYSLGSNSVVWLVDIDRYTAVSVAADEFSVGWMSPP
jgi:hypothetical protein